MLERTAPQRSIMVVVAIIVMMLGSILSATIISSRVIDSVSRPIPQALISDGSSHVFSNLRGYFVLESSADSLSVSRLGYLPQRISISEAQKLIILTADPLSLPAIRVYERYDRGSAAALDAKSIHPDTNHGRRSVGDLLLEHYSVHSSATPLVGESQTIAILGNLSRHTLVLIDGIPANTDGSAFDFSRIPASQVSHIELIKGASSVYGGSSAIGGIINIVSLQPQNRQQLELESTVGSFGMYHLRGLGSFSSAGLQLSAEYARNAAQNDFAYDSDQGDSTRRHNSTRRDYFFLKAAHSRNTVQVEALLSLSDFARELPGTVNNLPLFDRASMKGQDAIYRLALIHTRPRWNNELSLSGDASRATYRNLDSTNPFYRSHSRSTYLNFSFKDLFSLSLPPFALELSAEQRVMLYDNENLLDSAESLSIPLGANLTGISAFARHQKHWDIVSWEQGLGLRRDWAHRSDESQNTWRAEQSVTWHLPLEPRIYGSIGSAFALPSYQDMYWMGDSQAEGNKELKSEFSRAWLGGIKVGNSRFSLSMEYSQNRVWDLIRWQQYNGMHWKPQNLAKAQLNNLELSAELHPYKSLTLSGGIVFSSAKDKSPGNPALYDKYLLYTPFSKSGLSARLKRENWGSSVSWRHTGAQYTTPDNLVGSIPAFATLDLSAWLKVLPLPLTFNAALNNLLDTRYEIYAHTPQPGINGQIGLRLEF